VALEIRGTFLQHALIKSGFDFCAKRVNEASSAAQEVKGEGYGPCTWPGPTNFSN